MDADEFGPVCDNPACADQITKLNEQITELQNVNAELNGRLQYAEEQAA